jgi:hypothetical protein
MDFLFHAFRFRGVSTLATIKKAPQGGF